MSQTVAILGASKKVERYAYKAFKMLQEHGHQVVLVAPAVGEVEGIKVIEQLAEVDQPIDTLTMYVSSHISDNLEKDILKLKPARVIFNPGSENPKLEKNLKAAGIEVLEACTLVLLKTNQF